MSNSYFRFDGWIYMREGIGAEGAAPPSFGNSVPLNKSPYSRPFISHVPFIAVPPQPSIRRSIWAVVHWLFWLSLLYVVYEYFHLSILWYIHGRLRSNGWCGLIGWIQIRFLSNSDHQVLIQDLEIVCPWILKHSPICPRRQQELKIRFSMDNPKPDWFV